MSIHNWRELPGANLPPAEDDPGYELDFSWLDEIDKDDCFMTLNTSSPYKSLDFGCGGYTGSVTSWHELLQMTAPDEQCGVVFVRGDFPDSADSMLARAQRRNQNQTWGLGIRIDQDSDYILQDTSAQGMINLRWPCTRLNLVHEDKLLGSKVFGSYTICSFVKDGTLYQIARLPPSCPPESVSGSTSGSRPNSTAPALKLTVDVGGLLRIGCSSSVVSNPGGPPISFCDTYKLLQSTEEPWMLAAVSKRHERRLEMRLWIDRNPIPLSPHECLGARLHHTDTEEPREYRDEIAKLHAMHPVSLLEDKPITIIAAYSLVDSTTLPNFKSLKPITSTGAQDYLGVTESSLSAPYRLWSAAMGQAHSPESFELNAVGRAVEQILGVSAVPMKLPKALGLAQHQNHHAKRRTQSNSNHLPLEHPHIQQPSIVPSSPTKASSPQDYQCDGTPLCEHVELDIGIALVQNIIVPQSVDLPSTFWQVRILIKALKYLDARSSLPKNSEALEIKKHHYVRMHKQYRKELLILLRGVAKWVLAIVPKIGPHNRPNPASGISCSEVMEESHTPACRTGVPSHIPTQEDRRQAVRKSTTQDPRPRGHRWYCSLIIWYMMKQYLAIFEDRSTREHLWAALPNFDSIKNHEKIGLPSYVDDASLCLVRWYHSHSFVQICAYLRGENEARFEAYGIDVEKHNNWSRNWQVKSEKSLRLFGQGRLVHHSLHQAVVHLALLSDEISIQNTPLTQQGKSCFSLAIESIRDRKETSTLNPGRATVIRWDAHDMRSAVPRPAPWELNCLEHHALSGVQGGEDCIDRCKEFKLSDFTFMRTWDQSRTDAAAQWWNITTSSIVCATILRDQQKKMRVSSQEFDDEPPRTVLFAEPSTTTAIPVTYNDSVLSLSDTIKHSQTPRQMSEFIGSEQGLANDFRKVLEQFREQSKSKEDSDGFPWSDFRPQNLYHADTTIQSLEDTPQIFQLKQTRDTSIRPNIQKHFDKNGLTKPEWSLSTIKNKIPAHKLLHISCYDLALKNDNSENPEIGISSTTGAVDKTFWLERDSKAKASEPDQKDEDKHLRMLYFLGYPQRHPEFSTFSPAFQEQLQHVTERTKLLDRYQTSLFNVLNDSMVDLGTKYRVIFVQKMSPVILQALTYMWHPDALDTFDDHLGLVSQSTNTQNQSANGLSDVWTTSITLSHWRLQDEAENLLYNIEDNMEKLESGGKTKGNKSLKALLHQPLLKKKKDTEPELAVTADFPPRTMYDKRNSPQKGQLQLSTIRELSISLVITGDRMGKNWTCSIISEVIDEQAVLGYTKEIARIMQMFIHQQFTGRILSFLLLLGYMCESLSKECEKFTEELDKIMGMNPMVLLKGLEWHKSDVALRKLKEMLWGLEALRVFSDKLKRALEEIESIKSEMDDELKIGKEFRHRDMERTVEKIQEVLEKRYSRLKNSSISIRQRIDQSTRLREGIASVLSVEQNENISMLTWVTIAYLPLSFVAGAFSMGHGIVPMDAGWPTFGWLIALFVLVTMLFALSLQIIISRLRRVGNFITQFTTPNKVHPTGLEEMHSSSTSTDILKHAFGGVRRRIRNPQTQLPDEEKGDTES